MKMGMEKMSGFLSKVKIEIRDPFFSFQVECARVMHGGVYLCLVLMYRTETLVQRERRSRIRVEQMDCLRGLLDI